MAASTSAWQPVQVAWTREVWVREPGSEEGRTSWAPWQETHVATSVTPWA